MDERTRATSGPSDGLKKLCAHEADLDRKSCTRPFLFPHEPSFSPFYYFLKIIDPVSPGSITLYPISWQLRGSYQEAFKTNPKPIIFFKTNNQNCGPPQRFLPKLEKHGTCYWVLPKPLKALYFKLKRISKTKGSTKFQSESINYWSGHWGT